MLTSYMHVKMYIIYIHTHMQNRKAAFLRSCIPHPQHQMNNSKTFPYGEAGREAH